MPQELARHPEPRGHGAARRSDFDAQLAAHGLELCAPRAIETLQVNVGKLCNQACKHCHVDASPRARRS